MRKISAMYQRAGGTSYKHKCKDCKMLKEAKRGSKTVYKCRSYGITAENDSDWSPDYTACKDFNKEVIYPLLSGYKKTYPCKSCVHGIYDKTDKSWNCGAGCPEVNACDDYYKKA